MSKFRGSITLSIFSLSTLSNYHYWQSPKTRYWRLVRPYQTGIPPARLLALVWAHNPDLSVSHYTQYNSISQNVQSKKVCKIFIFSWHTSYCSISLFVFSQTNVPQGCPVRRFLTGRRVDWASGRLRSIFYSTTYLTFDSLRPSYFSCANSLSRNSDTSSMSSLSIKSSFINTSRSV